MAEYISCITDGATGVCRQIKDKEGRDLISALTTKLNEVIDTVNGLSGGSSFGELQNALNDLQNAVNNLDNTFASDEDVQALQGQISDLQNALNNIDYLKDTLSIGLGENSNTSNYSVAIGSGTAEAYTQASNHGVAIGHTADAGQYGVAIGKNAKTQNTSNSDVMNGTAIGYGTRSDAYSVAIGSMAKAQADSTVQIGEGTNTTPNTVQIFDKNIYNHLTDTLNVGNIKMNNEDILYKIFNTFYPIGTIYYNASDPTDPSILFGFGTWQPYAEGRVLYGAGTISYDGEIDHNFTAGQNIDAALPNITGSFTSGAVKTDVPTVIKAEGTGAFDLQLSTTKAKAYQDGSNTTVGQTVSFNARNSNSLYGASETVLTNGVVTYCWVRVE